MKRQAWQQQLERYRDGELPKELAKDADRLLESAEGREYDAALAAMADAARDAMPRAAIADAQLPAFVAGIREGVEAPRPGRRGFWALASFSAAASIVALSLFSLILLNSQDAVHSSVEAAASDIEGVEIDAYTDEEGTAVVWVSETGSDAW
jgi:hypothetical protein